MKGISWGRALNESNLIVLGGMLQIGGWDLEIAERGGFAFAGWGFGYFWEIVFFEDLSERTFTYASKKFSAISFSSRLIFLLEGV